MSGSRLRITIHAVERFRERWAPGFTYWRAKRELLFLAMGAFPMRNKSKAGGELWRCKWDDQIVFVVARNTRHQPVCVTILPPEPYDDVIDAYPLSAVG
jgi:hypothetical protein